MKPKKYVFWVFMYHLGRFPYTRMRRNRATGALRAMVAETHLKAQDLIWPIFIRENTQEPYIDMMPGIKRYAIDELGEVCDIALQYNIPAIAIFPATPAHLKDDEGTEALNEQNLVVQALRACKKHFGNDGDKCSLIVDIALDPYTSHGHDGLLINDKIDNDATIKKLCAQALLLSDNGADILAPSDMMDGRIGAIRESLEQAGKHDIVLLSYAAKYASHFYGPFRAAIGSNGLLKGDKKTYQMDYRNHDEALREIAKDIDEGADMVMVKPAMNYMDIIYHAKQEFKLPVVAYQVSGEYNMLHAGAEKGAFDFDAIMYESLSCLKRAGSDAIITYYAPQMAKILQHNQ